MDKKLMEETLNRIIALDRQTVELEQRTETDLKEKEQSFRAALRELETQAMDDVRRKSRLEYETVLEEANRQRIALIEASIERCHGLERLLEEREEELVRKVFVDLFGVEIG